MEILISVLVSALAVFITSKILPGVHVDSFLTAIIVAVVFGIVNSIIKPILLVLTLPINILSLGLFTVVIIAICVYIVDAIVPGFTVDGFVWALLFSLVLAIVSGFLNSLTA